MMKILHFVYVLKIGGAETFISNLLKSSPKDIEYHFAVQVPTVSNEFILNYLNSLSDERLHVIPSFPQHFFGQYKALKKLIIEHKFDAVHIHMNAMVNPIPILVCNTLEVKCIIHSHNSKNASGGKCARILHNIHKAIIQKSWHKRIACSQTAGEWMFGKRDFNIFYNSIDLEHFVFNKKNRNNTRESLGIPPDCTALGCVGRFDPQKNHKFLLEVFLSFKHSNPNSKLLLVGDGVLRSEIERFAQKLGVRGDVIFTGAQQDPAIFYSAMDCFVMTSIFEGLGFTAIEAQASGLPVIASTEVPSIIKLTDLVEFCPLSLTPLKWDERINEIIIKFSNKDRVNLAKSLKDSKFDIKTMSKAIVELYRN